jgi:hypothetical protein
VIGFGDQFPAQELLLGFTPVAGLKLNIRAIQQHASRMFLSLPLTVNSAISTLKARKAAVVEAARKRAEERAVGKSTKEGVVSKRAEETAARRAADRSKAEAAATSAPSTPLRPTARTSTTATATASTLFADVAATPNTATPSTDVQARLAATKARLAVRVVALHYRFFHHSP